MIIQIPESMAESLMEELKETSQHDRPKRTDRHKKPEMLPEPAAYYDRQGSRYPDRIRISFADGHTEIYDRRVNQPRPDRYLNWQGRKP